MSRRSDGGRPPLVTLCLLAGLTLGLLAGCPLAHEEPNTTSCYGNVDCFPGEYCEFPPPGLRKLGEPGVCAPRTGSAPFDAGAEQSVGPEDSRPADASAKDCSLDQGDQDTGNGSRDIGDGSGGGQ